MNSTLTLTIIVVAPAVVFDFTNGFHDTANATIQIDDSSSFSGPLTATQTLSVSQFTTSTLPRTRMWWRVRASDSSGTPGSWSAARRFEVK